MRWSIIRLIWVRELRDQLRDRRTLFMIAVLPMLLYPLLGFAVLKFATGFIAAPSTVGIAHGSERLGFPARMPDSAGRSPMPALAWLSAVPVPAGQGMDRFAAAAALAQAAHLHLDYPLLVNSEMAAPREPTRRPAAGPLLADVNVCLVF